LLLYLLQLVQALKYENFDEIHVAYEREKDIIQKEMSRRESTSSSSSDTEKDRSGNLHDVLEGTPESILEILGIGTGNPSSAQEEMDLATFLISRACNNSTLANYFCWYLIVECDDQDSQTKDQRILQMYVTVLKRFSQALNSGGIECRLRRAAIAGQQVFMERVVKLVKMVARESGNRKKKIEKLQSLLADPEILKFNFSNFDAIPLPLDPEVKITGIVSSKASLFKSALMPCRFTFKTTDDQEYVTIFKHGDDLRQDQLILQIITLMDKLLRKENLDLKLTPYKVLATSSKHGI